MTRFSQSAHEFWSWDLPSWQKMGFYISGRRACVSGIGTPLINVQALIEGFEVHGGKVTKKVTIKSRNITIKDIYLNGIGVCNGCMEATEIMDINEIRRENMRYLCRKAGDVSALAGMMEVSESRIRHLIGKTPVKNIGDRTARKLEQLFEMPKNWLDHPHPELWGRVGSQGQAREGKADLVLKKERPTDLVLRRKEKNELEKHLYKTLDASLEGLEIRMNAPLKFRDGVPAASCDLMIDGIVIEVFFMDTPGRNTMMRYRNKLLELASAKEIHRALMIVVHEFELESKRTQLAEQMRNEASICQVDLLFFNPDKDEIKMLSDRLVRWVKDVVNEKER